MLVNSKPVALLASPDAVLRTGVRSILESLGWLVETAPTGEAAMAAVTAAAGSMRALRIILVDAQLAGAEGGQLLAAIQESGVHKQCAIALIAEQASEDWIARLREGILDDIVPRNANAAEWQTHLNTMQRGHQLYCELENLRAAALMQVQHDSLTGTYNRSTMMSILFRETDRVQRLQGALCLMLIDIDDFGHWNSELGIEVCDQLLQQVASRVGRLLRSYDLLGRIGKDEFVLAMPGCCTVNAVMLAERLRMDVFSKPFLVESAQDRAELQVLLTACFAITSSGGRSPVVVLREAEQTLAHAKLSGPDTIRCTCESPLAAQALESGIQLPSDREMASW